MTLTDRQTRVLLLTRREREVLRLVADGLTNAEIGGRLGMAEQTAKNHVAAILAKLGATNRAHAAAIFARVEVA